LFLKIASLLLSSLVLFCLVLETSHSSLVRKLLEANVSIFVWPVFEFLVCAFMVRA
jgi:hypothetical protein